MPPSKKKDPTLLNLDLRPIGARAYLDGKPLGVGSNTYRVEPGNYTLAVKKQGYKTQSQKISIKSGKQQSYSFSLEKEIIVEKKSESQLALEDETAGRYAEALEYYDKVLEEKPRDLPAILGKARCLEAQTLEGEAVKYYRQAAAVAAEDKDAKSLYEALTGIIRISPNSFPIYDARGDLLYSRGDYIGAARDFKKVVELDHHNLKAHFKLGNSYYNNKEFHRALEAFKGAEELNFADPDAQACLAKTYRALNDKKNTKKAYEKFKELASYSTSLEYQEDPEWIKVLDYLGYEN